MKRWIVTVGILVSLVGAAWAQDPRVDSRRNLPGDFVINRKAYLYTAPSADAKIVTELREKTVIDVVEVREQWYKVQSTTGNRPGWIRRSYADPFVRGGGRGASQPRVAIYRLTSPSYVYASASTNAQKVATLSEGQEVRVTGAVGGNWYRIESESGDRPPGYIPMVAAQKVRDVE